MFKYLFQSMNEKLDGIIEALPASHGPGKRALLAQLQELKDISDGMIEEWLLFEEKMALATAQGSPAAAAAAEPAKLEGDMPLPFGLNGFLSESPANSMHYQRGEGYFKLYMFAEASREFGSVVAAYPDFLPARFYLALCCLQNENVAEACSHLHMLLSMAEDGKTKAAAYNALGCVQAVKGDVDKACEYFRLSHELDPNLKDPVYNLKACQIDGGVLQLGVAMG